MINTNKPGKVRRVCNAASEFEGQSLNKSLFIGPDLLRNLVRIIFRFREKPFGMCVDIEAMFLHVQVPAEDAKSPRFVWRENHSEDISIYESLVKYLEPKIPQHVPILLNRLFGRLQRTLQNNILIGYEKFLL